MTTSGSSATSSQLTILLVDDEPGVTRAVSRILGAQGGFDVCTATSAAEALEILRQRSVDVLVSDIDMPHMTGLELVRLARREFPSTLRILLTGAATMDRAVDAINEGEVVRFFTKPFDIDRFIRAFSDLRESILMRRRERHVDAQRERCDQLFAWIEERYPGALAFERGHAGEIVIDLARVRAFVESKGDEVGAFAGLG